MNNEGRMGTWPITSSTDSRKRIFCGKRTGCHWRQSVRCLVFLALVYASKPRNETDLLFRPSMESGETPPALPLIPPNREKIP